MRSLTRGIRLEYRVLLKQYLAPTLIFIGIIGSLPAFGQVDYATASLRGTIYDPQGAVIPAATVLVTNPATGISQTQNTDAVGTYQIQALTPAVYEVSVEAKGFRRAVAKNVVLTVGQILTYDIHLTLGSLSETV